MTDFSPQPQPQPQPQPRPQSWADVPPAPPAGRCPAGRPAPRHRRATPAVAALLVAGTTAASIAAGHYLWPASTARAAALADGSSGSVPAGGGGSGSSGLPSNDSSGAPSDVSAIAAKVDPALVDINTSFGYQRASGAGTGIVLSSNGVVLTNNHVIDGATSISVTDIGNGRTYKAMVVGYDKTADIAVLKLQDASGLRTATLANSSQVKVGEPVVAIGNAGGTGGTPSTAAGTVTALGRDITASDSLTGTSEQLTGLIQVDADVQPGDSGGPLVNRAGQVIGMDTAASSTYALQSQTSAGFAIPVDTAMSIAHQIQAGRSSSTIHVGATAFLGVSISSGNSSPAGGAFDPGGSSSGTGGSGFGYGGSGYGGSGYGTQGSSGATISGVVPGGAAAQAGLAAGDTITAIGSQPVSTPSDLSAAIAEHHPGDHVQMTWTDQAGQSHTATVDLASGPPA